MTVHARPPRCFELDEGAKEKIYNEMLRIVMKHTQYGLERAEEETAKQLGVKPRIQPGKPTFTCEFCGKPLKNKAAVTNHTKHCKLNPNACPPMKICQKCALEFHAQAFAVHERYCKGKFNEGFKL